MNVNLNCKPLALTSPSQPQKRCAHKEFKHYEFALLCLTTTEKNKIISGSYSALAALKFAFVPKKGWKPNKNTRLGFYWLNLKSSAYRRFIPRPLFRKGFKSLKLFTKQSPEATRDALTSWWKSLFWLKGERKFRRRYEHKVPLS